MQPLCRLTIVMADETEHVIEKPRLKNLEDLLEQLVSNGFLMVNVVGGVTKVILLKNVADASVEVINPEVI